jgi:hypothetical protein
MLNHHNDTHHDAHNCKDNRKGYRKPGNHWYSPKGRVS